MDQLRAIRYFVKVAESGSFSRAAEHFDVPPSSLSRRVSDLEAALGATLLKRSTRVVKLTEIGQRYYADVTNILLQLEATHESISQYQTRPMGQLRISSLAGFGDTVVLPLMDRFSLLYPDITLDITLSDSLSVLGRDEVDLAIRGGFAPDERVVAHRLMDNEFIAVASPAYLERYGTPTHPSELQHHKGLFFRTPNGPNPWMCELDGRWQEVSAPAVAISNAGRWLIQRAERGEGILMLPRWTLGPALKAGTLVPLEMDIPLKVTRNPNLAIYLLYQKTRYQVPKIKVAVDFLMREIPNQLAL
ncbi:MAG: LysR family transcriptional regulator [Alteromonadaceae bacterium]|uniref:LysR family transcriptional regulator n=1 Tax=unclassified Marinobacter TaxID=83889 RepID=UPI000C63F641|nr:LysR family transcriptional regulator [Marinobacter sp. BGYM27]MAA63702.1 LysR family transcriptional regulator [Alteromonadaceae bacterium]MBH84403.1 LysR family transcriptional regulator [Alteromonadaceae bacterium]MDG5498409.1 LysR substrate-binding domain-containing protein [Marinobacter sp. BGYM27]|tara:strand:+ start:26805 stop:27716 length:912 start_codon:yes stop_codon:yes gene_type:complete